MANVSAVVTGKSRPQLRTLRESLEVGCFFCLRRLSQAPAVCGPGCAARSHPRDVGHRRRRSDLSVASARFFCTAMRAADFAALRLGGTLWSSMPRASWVTPSTGGAVFFSENADETCFFLRQFHIGRMAWRRAEDCASPGPSTACRGRTRAGLPCVAATASPLPLGAATMPACCAPFASVERGSLAHVSQTFGRVRLAKKKLCYFCCSNWLVNGFFVSTLRCRFTAPDACLALIACFSCLD